MSRIVIGLTLGAGLAGVGLWAGATHLLGAASQAALAETEKALMDPEVERLVTVVDGGYERGFWKSRSVKRLGLVSDDADGDGAPDHLVDLVSEIYHGPVAMTPDGPVFGSGHAVTTLGLESLPEEWRTGILQAFGDRPPLVLKTTLGFGGVTVSQLEVAPFRYAVEGEPGTVSFDGLDARVVLTSDGETVRAALGRLSLGSWSMDAPDATVTVEPGSGDLDFREGALLKGGLRLGTLTVRTPAASGRLEGLSVTVDQKRVGEKVAWFTGDARLGAGRLSVSQPGVGELAVEEVAILSRTGVEGGKWHGSIRYGFGKLSLPAEAMGEAAPFLPVFEGGMNVELGARGFDFATIEKLMEQAEELQAAQLRQLASAGPGGGPPADPGQEAALAYAAEALNLIQPGVEITLKQEVAGRTATSVAEVKLGMAGERRLTQLKNLREIILALTGEASVTIPKADLTSEQAAGLMEGLSQAGYFVDGPESVSGKAVLKDGGIELNGEMTPFIESLGPMLDEPIPWETFGRPPGP